jgi:hypothetical protein
MFAAKPYDTGILKALDTELQFRNVPRAAALLENLYCKGRKAFAPQRLEHGLSLFNHIQKRRVEKDFQRRFSLLAN